MLAGLYLLLVAALAYPLRIRIALLAPFRGIPRYLCSLGLTLFLVNWVNFLLYVTVGAGTLYLRLSCGIPALALLYFSDLWKPQPAGEAGRLLEAGFTRLRDYRAWNYWFLALAACVLARFYAGIDTDNDGSIFSTFNFVDTPFHLSVVNAFLAAPHFPPMDLDMAPYPLKYHFLADFHVSHLVRIGLPALDAMWLMNLLSASIMVGTLWAVFERWLRLPAQWIMLGGFVFLFLNTALVNLLHYYFLQPGFFDPSDFFYGLLRFPYFNFESAQSNLLEPQRGLLFSLPVVLLIMNAAFGEEPESSAPVDNAAARHRVLQAFGLVCLLPLAHIVAFAVMSVALVPSLWRHLSWFFRRWWIWAPVFAIGVLQLLYLGVYGPPTNQNFSAWSFGSTLPLQNFTAVPAFARGVAFWFFANGDYFFWGALFAVLAVMRRRAPAASSFVWDFLVRWRWYFATCAGFFVLINFYRYSFDWGDSNKFVLFLNLGLTLVIVLGAAQWIGRPGRFWSYALWTFFLILSAGPPTYAFYRNVIVAPHGTVLLFEKNGRKAAEWVRRNLGPQEPILTAAYNTMHWVTPLAGRPTLAGIYGDSNPYRQDERAELIRRVYEEGALDLFDDLHVHYLCLSRNERRKYAINPKWNQLAESGQGVVFSSGEGADDTYSVYVFDTAKLDAQ